MQLIIGTDSLLTHLRPQDNLIRHKIIGGLPSLVGKGGEIGIKQSDYLYVCTLFKRRRRAAWVARRLWTLVSLCIKSDLIREAAVCWANCAQGGFSVGMHLAWQRLRGGARQAVMLSVKSHDRRPQCWLSGEWLGPSVCAVFPCQDDGQGSVPGRHSSKKCFQTIFMLKMDFCL